MATREAGVDQTRKPAGRQASSVKNQPGFLRRLWAWIGMGQLAVLLTLVLGIPALIVAANPSLAGYWWIVVIAVAGIILVPPLFYTPPRATPSRLREARAMSETMLDMRIPSSTGRSPLLWVLGALDVASDVIGALKGIIGGLIGAGAIVGVAALAGPIVGGVVCALLAGVAILKAVFD